MALGLRDAAAEHEPAADQQGFRGRILLQRRVDNDMWALPGGAMNFGESLPDCAVREVKEETGYDVEITGIVGTYTNPRHVFAYDDGEVRQEFSICFLARPVAGRLAVSEESTDVRWFEPDQVDALPMVPSIRKRVNDWRNGNMPALR
ncbi:NUDIX hydrolase [Streptomyces sp. NPDC001530]|uniref:NUDIX hydrolase n=1 Tax=Streptomyces sp. NPDC001530 TaxID=3364582 RepID=UPI0036786888